MPYGQVAQLDVSGDGADETVNQAGIAWWVSGHRANVKAAWSRVDRTGEQARDQFLLQCQAFEF
jgi:hypothetical protein